MFQDYQSTNYCLFVSDEDAKATPESDSQMAGTEQPSVTQAQEIFESHKTTLKTEDQFHSVTETPEQPEEGSGQPEQKPQFPDQSQTEIEHVTGGHATEKPPQVPIEPEHENEIIETDVHKPQEIPHTVQTGAPEQIATESTPLQTEIPKHDGEEIPSNNISGEIEAGLPSNEPEVPGDIVTELPISKPEEGKPEYPTELPQHKPEEKPGELEPTQTELPEVQEIQKPEPFHQQSTTRLLVWGQNIRLFL